MESSIDRAERGERATRDALVALADLRELFATADTDAERGYYLDLAELITRMMDYFEADRDAVSRR